MEEAVVPAHKSKDKEPVLPSIKQIPPLKPISQKDDEGYFATFDCCNLYREASIAIFPTWHSFSWPIYKHKVELSFEHRVEAWNTWKAANMPPFIEVAFEFTKTSLHDMKAVSVYAEFVDAAAAATFLDSFAADILGPYALLACGGWSLATAYTIARKRNLRNVTFNGARFRATQILRTQETPVTPHSIIWTVWCHRNSGWFRLLTNELFREPLFTPVTGRDHKRSLALDSTIDPVATIIGAAYQLLLFSPAHELPLDFEIRQGRYPDYVHRWTRQPDDDHAGIIFGYPMEDWNRAIVLVLAFFRRRSGLVNIMNPNCPVTGTPMYYI